MPYIPQDVRETLYNSPPTTPGELNYVLSMICLNYIGDRKSYQVYNEVVGVLECAKMELMRRKLFPYEDLKRQENGDIYG